MPAIESHTSLKPYNTFGIDVAAKHFCEIHSIEELKDLTVQKEFHQPKLWLGGGSNILLTKDFDGLVIKICLSGQEIISRSGSKVMVSAWAGENWHQFVLWTLHHDLGGLENLSLIPGNVGTAPIQNIGAYGTELKDVFHHLEAFNLETGEINSFSKKDCRFGYRDSVFKQTHKGKYVITRVFLELSPKSEHTLNTSYGAIERELEIMRKPATIHSVSEAVIRIRRSKLPDPQKIGNSGSFFKNPVVSLSRFRELQSQFPDIAAFKLSGEDYVKLAAGWMIEKTGWKGYRMGDAGVHQNQALVLVNYGGASGREIAGLAKKIQASVLNTFGVELEAEVNII